MHWELSLCGNYPHIDLAHHKEIQRHLNIKGHLVALRLDFNLEN